MAHVVYSLYQEISYMWLRHFLRLSLARDTDLGSCSYDLRTTSSRPKYSLPNVQPASTIVPSKDTCLHLAIMTISSLGILSAAGPIINATITIPQRLFEIKAVSQQARDLLETSNQINQTLEYARTLRDQKAPLLSATEKRWIDDVLGNAERAVKSFALLIEPARVDMQTSPANSLSLATRTLFVLRDSPKVAINLSHLSIAVQHLNTAVGTLSSRNGAVANGSGGAVGGGGGGGSNNNSTAAFACQNPRLPPGRQSDTANVRGEPIPELEAIDSEHAPVVGRRPWSGRDRREAGI